MPERTRPLRSVLIFCACAAWAFLLLSLLSYQPTDAPSHGVYRPDGSPTGNWCGGVGATVAYWAYFAIGAGTFPILFFSAVFIALLMMNNRLSDVWLRVIGLFVLAVAVAAITHQLRPGSRASLPEGHGGVMGIAAASFLQAHFNRIGTTLILLTTLLVGLILAADDLVLRGSGLLTSTLAGATRRVPKFNFAFPELPKLPALAKFVTRDAVAAPTAVSEKAAKKTKSIEEESEEPLKPEVVLKRPRATPKPKAVLDDAIDEASANADPVIDVALVEKETVAPLTGSQKKQAPAEEKPSRIDEPPPPPKRDIVVNLPSMVKPKQLAPTPPKELGDYTFPHWDMLADAESGFSEQQEQYVREKAAVLEQALKEFDIDARVVEIDTGPVITMYELSLAPGIKVSSITALANDISRALAAVSVRIVAPVPGKHTVGIEVPNATKEKVRLKDLMQLAPEATSKMAIPLYLGKDASGEPLITDLAAMPHCLIAGTTGSGKSVCINTIIMSIAYTKRPDETKLILVDPKVVEMAPFKDIPHLMCPVITETGKACSVLDWACEKMDERYEVLAEAGVRNIKDYNKMTWEELKERFNPGTPEEEAKIPKKMPYIVIIIDELADLMMTSGKEVESFIVRLAQKARAVGIHLIVATQRPQATVVTGLIKSNMPSKIAFRVSSKMDSRIVLDQNGAELLLGHGDMLFLPPGASKPIRSQGTYLDDKEIRDSVKLIKTLADAQYEPELVQIKSISTGDGGEEQDELFEDAVRVVLETKRGSVSLLQRRLTIGYSRASRLIEQMAAAGLVGEYKGSQAREATITLDEWDAMKAQQQKDAENGMTV